MPRSPPPSMSSSARQRRLPEYRQYLLAHLDRRSAAREPARARSGADRQVGSTPSASGRGGAPRDWVEELDFDVARLKFFDARAKAPAAARPIGPEWRDRSGSTTSSANVNPRQEVPLDRVKVTRGDLTPDHFAAWPRSRAISAALRPPNRAQNRFAVGAPRSFYDVWELGEWAWRERPREITTCYAPAPQRSRDHQLMGLNHAVQRRSRRCIFPTR